MEDANNEFLVQKPQFSESLFDIGGAIRVSTNGYVNDGRWDNRHCLVEKVTPLELTVVYLDRQKPIGNYSSDEDDDTERCEMVSCVIPVDKVSDGTYKLEKLVPQFLVKAHKEKRG